MWPSAIPNAKKYNALGGKSELPKDDLSRTDGYIQTAVCLTINAFSHSRSLEPEPSSITREIAKGMDNGMYNPVIAEAGCLEARRNQRLRLKMTDEAWAVIKPQKEYPDYAMSGKTIYNYVFFHMKGELKKPALKDLRLRGKARKKGKEGKYRE